MFLSLIRIDELYESVQKYDGMAAALPDIVDRLETLQGLHQQGELVKEIGNQPQILYLLWCCKTSQVNESLHKDLRLT